MEESSNTQKTEPIKVLEFYSGIGGMRYSLMKSGVDAKVVQAFEINDIANDVYQHNFGHRPYQGNIQSLTAADLDKYQAHLWLLSPPCQPYTRQGLQKDSSDARAFSFLNILELIPQLSYAPHKLLVENVVGFETSVTRNKMIEVLAKTGYVTQEFILSPLQFKVPYSRPRYFCLAKRNPSCFQYARFNNTLLYTPSPLFGCDDGLLNHTPELSPESLESMLMSCEPIQNFLEFECCTKSKETVSSCQDNAKGSHITVDFVQRWGQNVGCDGSSFDQYLVPLSLIEQWGNAMGILHLFLTAIKITIDISHVLPSPHGILNIIEDIVYPNSKRCCCFTKSYYRYVKGTGSLLATIEPKLKGKVSSLECQGLRYFTPREVANLHSFPEEFCFPEHISLRQRYALLGNSLSAAVVGPLIKYLCAEAS